MMESDPENRSSQSHSDRMNAVIIAPSIVRWWPSEWSLWCWGASIRGTAYRVLGSWRLSSA